MIRQALTWVREMLTRSDHYDALAERARRLAEMGALRRQNAVASQDRVATWIQEVKQADKIARGRP